MKEHIFSYIIISLMSFTLGVIFTDAIAPNKKSVEKQSSDEQLLKSMTPPIVLMSKEETMAGWSIVLIDSNKNVQAFGDLTIVGSSIGASHQVGDTIIH